MSVHNHNLSLVAQGVDLNKYQVSNSGELSPKSMITSLFHATIGGESASKQKVAESVTKAYDNYLAEFKSRFSEGSPEEKSALVNSLDAIGEKALTSLSSLGGDPETIKATLKKGHIFQKTMEGLESNESPKQTTGSESTSYFMKGADGKNVAVFKPQSGERLWRTGIQNGRGAAREVAVSRLDHGHFASVPIAQMTTFASKQLGVKEGSTEEKQQGALIEFIKHDLLGTKEIPPENFDKIDPSSVRRAAILDIRIWNTDRHVDNFLVQVDKNDHGEPVKYNLIPFDHGSAFSEGYMDMVGGGHWMDLPGVDQPFNQEELKYIRNLDIKQDIQILREEGMSAFNGQQLAVSTILLKKGAEAGLTAKDIGQLCTDHFPGDSIANQILQKAISRAENAREESSKINDDSFDATLGIFAYQDPQVEFDRILKWSLIGHFLARLIKWWAT